MTLFNPPPRYAAYDRLSNAHAASDVAAEKAMEAARAINDNLVGAPPSTVRITATLQVANSLGEIIDIESHSWKPSWAAIERALDEARAGAPRPWDITDTPDAETAAEALNDVLDYDDVVALLIESATSLVPPVVRAHRGPVHLSARPIAAQGQTHDDDRAVISTRRYAAVLDGLGTGPHGISVPGMDCLTPNDAEAMGYALIAAARQARASAGHIDPGAAAELLDGAGADPLAVADDVARDYGTLYGRAVDMARTIAAMTAEHQVTSRGPDGAWEPVSEWDGDVDAVRREYETQVEELGAGNVDVVTRYVTGGTAAATMPWRD